MPDTLTPDQRSERMARVKSRDTIPEMIVRRLVHGLGYRYRLHRRDLPGAPDLVFANRRKVIFVHGCFWHRHDDPACRLTRTPRSRIDFWERKFTQNQERDERNLQLLRKTGWSVMIVWECQIPDREALTRSIKEFLNA